MHTVDIITSAYNEEDCIPELYRRIDEVFSTEINYRWTLIIIDNGSNDNTWRIISEIASNDSRIQGYRMSRKFTLDEAFTAGLDRATSDFAIIMCSDLQDPPEAIPALLRESELGYQQVIVRIRKRSHVPLVRRFLSRVFYLIAGKLTDNQMPQGVSDFRLISRNVYSAVREMREKHRFMRGIFAWTGFRSSFIEIDRPERFAGESAFLNASLIPVIQWSILGLISNSTKPLNWISGFGIFSSMTSILIIASSSIFWLVYGVPFAGFGTLLGVIFLGFSMIFLFLGVMSQYVALIFDQSKGRPIYVIAETTKNY